jgi:hypothetical protein
MPIHSTMSSDKPTLDRRVLEQHGLIFSEEVYSPRSDKSTARVPEHVEHTREALLEHDIQVPDTLRSLFEKEQKLIDAECSVLPPPSAFQPLPHNTGIKAQFEQVAKLARIAREYAAAQVSQQTWEHFLRSYIFQSFEESAMHTPKHA